MAQGRANARFLRQETQREPRVPVTGVGTWRRLRPTQNSEGYIGSFYFPPRETVIKSY